MDLLYRREDDGMAKLDNPLQAMVLVSMIGGQIAVSVLLGYWGGQWMDDRFATEPLFLIVGILSGLSVGIYGVMKIVKSYLGD
jgi:ATP synthase protein I